MTTGLILGAAVWADGPSPTLRRRTLHAAALYHADRVDHLIACGGLGDHPPSEAEAMARLLQGAGVPEEAITLEDRSTNTAQNIANAAALLSPEQAARPVIIITDAYHAPRARMTARRHGLTAQSSHPGWRGARMGPQIRMILREVPAYLAYALRLR